MFLLTSIFGVLLFLWIIIRLKKPKKFPPGPLKLPLVGSIPFIQGSGNTPSLILGISKQVKKHGKLCGFYIGNEPFVIISDYLLIKEAFKNESLAARPSFPILEDVTPGSELMNWQINGGRPGVVFSHGQYWKELRRFLLKNLKDFGFGRSSMEELFQEEVKKLCQVLSKTTGQPINLMGTMNISIVNAIWHIVTGEKLEIEDPNLRQIAKLLNNFLITVSLNGANPLALFLTRSMTKWPLLDSLSGYKVCKDAMDPIIEMMMENYENHQKTLDPNNIRDFLDLMLVEKQNQKERQSCFIGDLGKMTVINSMMDLFVTAMDTTASSLVAAFLQLLHHPEVQVKAQQEIDSVIGFNRLPRLSDKDQMPYINAVLHESLRVTSLLVFGVPHCTLDDVQLDGFTIPKGSTVLANLYHVMRDPSLFQDPETFNPDRFIDEDGKFVPNDHVIPFGLGKRSCLGQSMAEKEIFIFFVGLLQQFEFRLAPGTTLPSYKEIFPKVSLMRVAPEFEVVLKRRF